MTSTATSTTAVALVFVALSAHTPPHVFRVQRRPPQACLPSPPPTPISCTHIFTTVDLCEISPDSTFVSELVHSLTYGFNIGYYGPRTHLTAPNR